MGMALRCFLFSSDEGTSDVIRQVISTLEVEGESCSEPTAAVEKLARELFQIVIVDWEQQPQAGMLISASRERKPAERPLVLAIVGDDASVPKALQAGANSILRKPLTADQVIDTLTTARDLLRSRKESTATAAQAAAAAASAGGTASGASVTQAPLRPAEHLQPNSTAPNGQIETDSEIAHFPEQSAAEQTDPLKDLEPVAASMQGSAVVAAPPDEPKGLEWYLKARGVTRQPGSVMATSAQPSTEKKAELLGYEQSSAPSRDSIEKQASRAAELQQTARQEDKQEAQLFSYITGEKQESSDHAEARFTPRKKAIFGALILAAIAVVAAPQAPWHGKIGGLVARERRVLHGWLNPQPVTAVTQAPTSHEDFGRPGDEYKLPVAETIPDATTDPSQISVVPVVDPTAKKPATDANGGQPLPAPDGSAATPVDANPTSPAQTPTIVPAGTEPGVGQPGGLTPTPPAMPDTSSHPDVSAVNPDGVIPTTSPKPSVIPRAQTQSIAAPTRVPSSLKSQIATMVPDAGGNKPIEAALPAIEPVNVPELTERSLLLDQPKLAYPSSAAGRQGTVTLQVLIGRDGTVQDAKFVQGSLVFARSAIDGVKQWKFKPYIMNGRPVSVETSLTLKFAPAQ